MSDYTPFAPTGLDDPYTEEHEPSPPGNSAEKVTWCIEIERETERAYQVRYRRPGANKTWHGFTWLPKSQITLTEMPSTGKLYATLPKWLADQKENS